MDTERGTPPFADPSDTSLADRIHCGPLVIDHVAHEVSIDDREVPLTLREYALVRFLLAHPSRVYTREALVAVLWGDQRDVGMRTIDGHVRRVRAKLGPELRDCIRTVRGVGYAFSPAAVAGRGGSSAML